MKTILTIIGFLVLFNLNGRAQETEKIRKQQFGINAGFTTGLGFSYRYWPAKLGVQATFLPIKAESDHFYSIGLTGLYQVTSANRFATFVYLGNHLVMSDTDDEYNIGLGYGIAVGKIVQFNGMLGYGVYDVTKTVDLYPTVEIGLYYKF